ncbi:MAG: hypothetical protein IPK75_12660 [Acidobacteria bacterium]|nr:hypothetical protein [Acidobacteriota bacterium]
MIDHAITRIRQLVADKKITLGQVSEVSGLPYSTVHEMLQPAWGTRAIENLRKLEGGLSKIEEIAGQGAAEASP